MREDREVRNPAAAPRPRLETAAPTRIDRARSAGLSSSVHRCMTALRVSNSRAHLETTNAKPPMPVAMGTTGSWVFEARSSPTSWMIPPAAPRATNRPAVRNDALPVDSSSSSCVPAKAAPAAMRIPRTAKRHAKGESSGAMRTATESTDEPTARAERTARPPATPWWTKLRGISEGPKESSAALEARGPLGPEVIGFSQLEMLTAALTKEAVRLIVGRA